MHYNMLTQFLREFICLPHIYRANQAINVFKVKSLENAS